MAVRDNEMVNLNTDEEVKKVLDLLGQSGDSGDATAMAKLNELLKKMGSDVAGVTAQTKSFTETVYGRIDKGGNPVAVYGKGRVIGNKYAGFAIDGGDSIEFYETKELFFEKSVVIHMIEASVGGAYAEYIIQT